MDILSAKRKQHLPFLKSRENKIIFWFITIYLALGVTSLIITIFYLLSHLNISDRIIYQCIPGFALGISSGIIYFIGYPKTNFYTGRKLHRFPASGYEK